METSLSCCARTVGLDQILPSKDQLILVLNLSCNQKAQESQKKKQDLNFQRVAMNSHSTSVKNEVANNIIFSLQEKSYARRYEVSNEDLIIIRNLGACRVRLSSWRSYWTRTVIHYRVSQKLPGFLNNGVGGIIIITISRDKFLLILPKFYHVGSI
ncbi:hypothetical protein V2J09_023494 [Rumex salicifolius]